MNKASKIEIVQRQRWPCSSLDDKYELKEELGRGTYGAVYRAYNRETGKECALKKMEHIEDKSNIGFPITTFREIRLLQGIVHEHILTINEVICEKSRGSRPIIYLSLELMQCDLSLIVERQDYRMTSGRIQVILRQILDGLRYLHEKGIAHRDIKPTNILINAEGRIRIADFGLAKRLTKLSTLKVVTLWYRAPELLLGQRNYSTKIDVWSVGCLAAELILRKPLFAGEQNEKQILNAIFRLVGTPDRCNFEEEFLHSEQYKEIKPNFSNDS